MFHHSACAGSISPIGERRVPRLELAVLAVLDFPCHGQCCHAEPSFPFREWTSDNGADVPTGIYISMPTLRLVIRGNLDPDRLLAQHLRLVRFRHIFPFLFDVTTLFHLIDVRILKPIAESFLTQKTPSPRIRTTPGRKLEISVREEHRQRLEPTLPSPTSHTRNGQHQLQV